MLKSHVEKIEEVDEKYRELYVKTDKGDYQLQLDDIGDVVTAKERVKEFRDNNIQLKKQLSEMEAKIAKFGDVDVDEYKKLKEQINKNNEKGGDVDQIDPKKLDEIVSERTKGMLDTHKKELSARDDLIDNFKKELANKDNELTKILIDSSLRDSVIKAGVPKAGAMEDILERGRKVWKINDEGKAVPMNNSGDVIRSKLDARNIMSMEEWAENLALDGAPFLFELSSGSGATGNKTGTKTTKSDLEYLSKLSLAERMTQHREMQSSKAR